MKATTETALYLAWQYCDDEDKSTEFMFQYMRDMSGMSYDKVVDFVITKGGEERIKWLKNNQDKTS